MPKPRPVFPKEKTISLQASILFSITSFLETPLTKKQFIATCFVCAGAAYLYQKEYYPKLSCAPILNLFKTSVTDLTTAIIAMAVIILAYVFKINPIFIVTGGIVLALIIK